ncbi:MAG: hypothetical protein ACYDAX_14055 [Desulfobacteria bacterium]
MRNAISVALVFAGATLAVYALATPDDAAPSWMLLFGVVILTSLMISVGANAAARQAGLASAVAVLFPVLAENGKTGKTITGVTHGST